MHYNKIIPILIFSLLSGQSLFNRWIGTDPFIGSSKSNAMGYTHVINSMGSYNVRFNPAKIAMLKSNLIFNIQINRSSVFERWSMPIRDSFGDFLTNADYVSNEFDYYGNQIGFIYTNKLLGLGFNYAPLTHFNYQYLEEVRGTYRIDDGEYASKDPLIGYHNINIEGKSMVKSGGGGVKFALDNIVLGIGASLNIIEPTTISDFINIDTLNTDVTNLSYLLDTYQITKTPSVQFINISSILDYKSKVKIGFLWENEAKVISFDNSTSIDSTNGLFNFFSDSIYSVIGTNYCKPEIKAIALTYYSNTEQQISISFEYNLISYNKHLNLNDYKQYKFGFEYITQMGIPIRGGLMYKQNLFSTIKPTSLFTLGSSKSFANIIADFSATYTTQSFYYKDLFPVINDIRFESDLVRDSQFNLHLNISYKF